MTTDDREAEIVQAVEDAIQEMRVALTSLLRQTRYGKLEVQIRNFEVELIEVSFSVKPRATRNRKFATQV